MKRVLKTASLIGLGLTVLPAFLVFGGRISWETHVLLMMGGTLLWFITAPFWIHREAADDTPALSK